MTDYFNLDTAFFEKSFAGHDGRARDNHLDASEVLAAALEQMDDIIASTNEPKKELIQQNSISCIPPNSHCEKSCPETTIPLIVQDSNLSSDSKVTVNKILDHLKEYILSKNDANDNFVPNRDFNIGAAKVVFSWLHKQFKNLSIEVPVHSEDIDSLRKIQEIETDKNLLLQASVLADQVDAQADKIIELERLLQQRKEELLRMEQTLHQEIINRSSVENSKLELMTELSNLRLRLTAAERDRKESDDKCRKLEHELALCQARLFEKEAEYSALKDKISRYEDRILLNESSEIEKLKSALDSVFITSDKDQKREDLQSSLTRYKKLQDIVLSSHSHLRKKNFQ